MRDQDTRWQLCASRAHWRGAGGREPCHFLGDTRCQIWGFVPLDPSDPAPGLGIHDAGRFDLTRQQGHHLLLGNGMMREGPEFSNSSHACLQPTVVPAPAGALGGVLGLSGIPRRDWPTHQLQTHKPCFLCATKSGITCPPFPPFKVCWAARPPSTSLSLLHSHFHGVSGEGEGRHALYLPGSTTYYLVKMVRTTYQR